MFRSTNDFFREMFNEKIYKISLDGGMSCPNRDKDKNGGCIFCSSGGSGDFSVKYNGNITESITKAIELVKDKNAKKFIAYFQSYTNTYAEIDYLSKLFYGAINDERIVALSIGTRPDSISDECYKLLDDLNKIKPVFIELGLQTSNDIIADLINRGYKTEVYKECAIRLRSIGINVITHVIIGLPFESNESIYETIDVVNKYSDGVKLQLLHVLKDTKLEEMYLNNEFKTLEKDEYIKILGECIERLKDNIVVHRITGDGAKNILVSPLYSSNKKDMINSINKYFNENNINQGSKYRG